MGKAVLDPFGRIITAYPTVNQERRHGEVATLGAGKMVVVAEQVAPLSPRWRQRRLSSKSMEPIELLNAVDKME